MPSAVLLERRNANPHDFTSTDRGTETLRLCNVWEKVCFLSLPFDESKLFNMWFLFIRYDTPGGLSTHKKQIHSAKPKTESNVCHVCAKIFSTRTGLHEHMSTIHQPREMGQLQCKKCGKWLMNYRCLKTHMILHSDAKFDCTVCEYTTKKKFLLDRHMVAQVMIR